MQKQAGEPATRARSKSRLDELHDRIEAKLDELHSDFKQLETDLREANEESRRARKGRLEGFKRALRCDTENESFTDRRLVAFGSCRATMRAVGWIRLARRGPPSQRAAGYGEAAQPALHDSVLCIFYPPIEPARRPPVERHREIAEGVGGVRGPACRAD